MSTITTSTVQARREIHRGARGAGAGARGRVCVARVMNRTVARMRRQRNPRLVAFALGSYVVCRLEDALIECRSDPARACCGIAAGCPPLLNLSNEKTAWEE